MAHISFGEYDGTVITRAGERRELNFCPMHATKENILNLNQPRLTEAEIAARAEIMSWVLAAPEGFWEKYFSGDRETLRLVRKYCPLYAKPKRKKKSTQKSRKRK